MGQEALLGAWTTPSLPYAINLGGLSPCGCLHPSAHLYPRLQSQPPSLPAAASFGALQGCSLAFALALLSVFLKIPAFLHPCVLCNPPTMDHPPKTPLANPAPPLPREMSPVHGGQLALTLLPGWSWGGWRLVFTPDNLQTFSFLLLEIEDDGAVGMCRSHLGRGERVDSRTPGIKRPEQAGYQPIFTISAAASPRRACLHNRAFGP